MSGSLEPSAERLLRSEILRFCGLDVRTDVERLPEPQRTHVRYGLTTVDRGVGTLRLLSGNLRPGFRHLDVGCAYGGFLIAAARAGASEVVGLEYDGRLAALARRLTAAFDVGARIVHGDLADQALVGTLGQFDLITCEDVIEHVGDVAGSLANLARALRPGGLLRIAVPNARCPQTIRRDPHYQAFGMTLLPPRLAAQYHRHAVGGSYDVGTFLRRGSYVRMLEAHGLHVALANVAPRAPEAALRLAGEFARLRGEGARFADDRIPAECADLVRRRVGRECDRFARRLAAAVSPLLTFDLRRGKARLKSLVADYHHEVWHFHATRPVASGR